MSLLSAMMDEGLSASELETPLKEVWFAIRTDGDGIGDGPMENPFAANTAESFSNLMVRLRGADLNNVPKYLIHLGPGTFRTRGGAGDGFIINLASRDKLWAPFPGWRIRGAGLHATTLQFVWDLLPSDLSANNPAHRHTIIASDGFLTDFQLSDLTLDCQLEKLDPTAYSYPISGSVANGGTTVTASAAFFTPSMIGSTIIFPGFTASITAVSAADPLHATISTAPATTISGKPFWVSGIKFTITALAVAGDNILIERVRVINFGTRAPFIVDGAKAPASSTLEGFPLRVNGRTQKKAGFACVIRDCVFEQPQIGPAREVTCAVLGGGIYAGAIALADQPLHLQPVGAVIRDCYFNFEFINPRNGLIIPVQKITWSNTSSVITIETQFPHNLSAQFKDFVEVKGSPVGVYNGRFFR